MQLTLDIPDILVPKLPENAAREVLEAVVIRACIEGEISRGKAGELLGLSFGETEEFFVRHRISLAYGWEELEKDRINLAQ